MIKFRQKVFFWNALLAATSLIGVGQGAKANRIQKQQGDAAMAEQKRVNDAQLNLQKQEMRAQQQAQKKAQQDAMKLAKAQIKAENPKPGLFSQKEFANAAIFRPLANVAKKALNSGTAKKIMSSDLYKNASGFAKDVYRAGKQGDIGKKALGMAATGATMAGAGYVVDKAIQADAKKNGIPIDNSGSEQDTPKKKGAQAKKIALGTLATGATIATGFALGKRGKLNMDTLKKAGKSVGTAFKEQIIKGPASAEEIQKAKSAVTSGLNSNGKPMNWVQKKVGTIKLNRMSKSHLNVGSLAMTGAFAALPVVSYVNQKKQLQEQTKEYAIPAGKFFKEVGLRLKEAPGKVTEFLSWGAGRSGQKAAGAALANQAAKSNNKWTKGVSNFLSSDKNKFLKVAGGVAAGSTVMFAPFSAGDKAVRKVAKAADKKAFAYEESQNKQVQ